MFCIYRVRESHEVAFCISSDEIEINEYGHSRQVTKLAERATMQEAQDFLDAITAPQPRRDRDVVHLPGGRFIQFERVRDDLWDVVAFAPDNKPVARITTEIVDLGAFKAALLAVAENSERLLLVESLLS